MTDDNEKIEPVADAKTADDSDWQKTLARLGLSEPNITKVRSSDILYFAKRWQFLQVVEGGGHIKPLEKPALIEGKSGWTIINFGDAMTTSPGKFLFRGGYFCIYFDDDDDDEGGGEGGGIVNPKKGTIFKQAFDSAAEIIQLAKELGWNGVQIVDGHPDMQRAAWVEACRIGVRLDGYQPNVDAEKQRRRIVSQSIDEMHAALKGGR